MSRPIVKLINVQTGEEIEREMNDEELTQYESDKIAAEQRKLNEQAQAAAKAALLERLGISEQEAKLLLG